MQLKKHIKKRSKQQLIARAKDALRFNPQDKDADKALQNLQK